MLARIIVIGLAGLFAGACASEQRPRVFGYQGSAAYSPISTASAAVALQDKKSPVKRSMASKVLAAMALERVTGRKPDPARLAALD